MKEGSTVLKPKPQAAALASAEDAHPGSHAAPVKTTSGEDFDSRFEFLDTRDQRRCTMANEMPSRTTPASPAIPLATQNDGVEMTFLIGGSYR